MQDNSELPLHSLKNPSRLSLVSKTVRILIAIFIFALLIGFAIAIIWRLDTWIAILAPVSVVIIVALVHVYYTRTVHELLWKKTKIILFANLST